MVTLAESVQSRPDARVRWLVDWIKVNLLSNDAWNNRRLIIFTEWEDTRRYVEKRLREALADADLIDDRIGVFTGMTGQDRREEVKAAFNTDPAKEPLRILICTDAAREGINLQTYCADLVHFDLPWNPSRLEQRNGRIDRKLQPAKKVFCRYFRYQQRDADIVMDALVRKTEVVERQLGSAGQVIEERIKKRMADGFTNRAEAEALAKAIEDENDPELISCAQAEMDDGERARHDRLLKEQEELRGALKQSCSRVGVSADDLTRVAGAALSRAGFALDSARGETVGDVATFKLDPDNPAFAHESSWNDVFDDLRTRRRKRGEKLSEWRKNAAIRPIVFEPPRMPDGRYVEEVVQVHLEHRLVRRLLSRFLSQGFQAGLSRFSVIEGPGAQPRVVLMGRLALYGAGAARLHEEIIPVTAIWAEADRSQKPLRALGESGEERTLNQLEDALRNARPVPQSALARVKALVERDIADLVPVLQQFGGKRINEVKTDLAKRGAAEARLLSELLERQRNRIAKASADFDPNQFELPGIAEAERRERNADRRHWQARLERLETELREEPARIEASYNVHAQRLEPVGLVYLWPASD